MLQWDTWGCFTSMNPNTPPAVQPPLGTTPTDSKYLFPSVWDYKSYESQSRHESSVRRCPVVRYSKHNLYDLIDKQKTVKIDSYEALLDYQLYFTKVTREAERLLEKGYHSELREACITRDQQRAREAQYEARVQESKATRAEEQCRGMERCSFTALEIQSLTYSLQDSLKLLKVLGESSRSQALKVDGIEVAMAEPSSLPLVEEEPLTVRLQGDCLQGKLEEQSKEKLLGVKASVELEATEALGDSPVPQSEYLHPSSSPHADILPQNPPIEPQDAQDEPRTDEQPIEAVVLTLKVPKPTPEPRDDLCEVPEQAGHTKVEEIKLEVEIERQSKVVARRKPPEVKI
ncbi:hypothetical protein EDD16DRAFT_1521015 [Pisolithus croceorrhizus]|nr:hypothetical protein EDD16DRAFT_1521015 [Pisolithus croceorrhizus]KAI6146633.1 hypothetical protein EDD17DRAFT_1514727 [Pisolithus thermaeus]